MLAIVLTYSLAVLAPPTAAPPVNVVVVVDWARSTRLPALAGPPTITIERALIRQVVEANPEVNFGVITYTDFPRVLVPLPPSGVPDRERAQARADFPATLANAHTEGSGSRPALALRKAEAMLRAADPQGNLPSLIVLLASHSGYEGDELLGLPLERARADAVLQDTLCALAKGSTSVLLMRSAIRAHSTLLDRLQRTDVAPAYDAEPARKAFQAALQMARKHGVNKPPAAECINVHALAQMDQILLHDVVSRVGDREFYISEASVDARAMATPFIGCTPPTAAEWSAAAQRAGFVPATVPERLSSPPGEPTVSLYVSLDGNQPVWSTKPLRTSVQRCAWPSSRPVLTTATALALTPLYPRRDAGAGPLRRVPLGAEVHLMSELSEGWRWASLADGAQGWMREIQPWGPNLPALVRDTMSAATSKPIAANLCAAAVAWRASGIPEGVGYAEDYEKVAAARDPAEDSFAELAMYKFRGLMGLVDTS